MQSQIIEKMTQIHWHYNPSCLTLMVFDLAGLREVCQSLAVARPRPVAALTYMPRVVPLIIHRTIWRVTISERVATKWEAAYTIMMLDVCRAV